MDANTNPAAETLTATHYPEQDSPEYWAALRAGRPVRPPRYYPGDWVYDSMSNRNVRVVRMVWDNQHDRAFYRVSVPGHTAPEDHFVPELPGVARQHYRRVALSENCWEPCSDTDAE